MERRTDKQTGKTRFNNSFNLAKNAYNSKILLLSTLLLIVSLFFCGTPDILDPEANNPLLRKIATYLHDRGIDVVQDWKSKGKILSNRPIVAPLADYPTSLVTKKERWIKEFNQGAMGLVVAAETTQGREANNSFANFFEKLWNSVSEEKRVFISFAREDVENAKLLKMALEEQGYVAFIYLSEVGQAPPQSVGLVGEFLRTAGNRLVIDTETARHKQGVLAEALALARYNRPPYNGSLPIVATTPKTPIKPKGTNSYPAHNYRKSETTSTLPAQASVSPTRTSTYSREYKTPRHVVEVYGRKSCPRTVQAIEIFEKQGAVVKFRNIQTSPLDNYTVQQNTRYLAKSSDGGPILPFIKVDGKPIYATNAGLSDCIRSW